MKKEHIFLKTIRLRDDLLPITLVFNNTWKPETEILYIVYLPAETWNLANSQFSNAEYKSTAAQTLPEKSSRFTAVVPSIESDRNNVKYPLSVFWVLRTVVQWWMNNRVGSVRPDGPFSGSVRISCSAKATVELVVLHSEARMDCGEFCRRRQRAKPPGNATFRLGERLLVSTNCRLKLRNGHIKVCKCRLQVMICCFEV